MTNTMTRTTTSHPASPRRDWRRFARHYIEMFIGMFALGALQSFAGLDIDHREQPELGYLIMAVNMSIGMIAIMRYRGHGWASTLEMCGAMFAPIVPLYPMLWLGVIDAGGLMMATHIAMFPLMLAVMVRRLDEFTRCH
ncbi:hypothetical protein [Allosalinactinospora lopnorensis]|uniref:hypothetical protein n=1 Tax=Allosalinactinospora lopnorensis TaxID=1352348 RepID=UPI000697507A|nr:hypothetical protein [Allosalinactinospora lopnorensis]